jgi:hypothetical protein
LTKYGWENNAKPVNAESIVLTQSNNLHSILHFSLTSATSWQGSLFSLHHKTLITTIGVQKLKSK